MSPGLTGDSALTAVLPFGGALPEFRFDPASMLFTPQMAERTGHFADYGWIAQGRRDGTGTPDVVNLDSGDILGNLTETRTQRLDPCQGTASFWICPEWDGDDGIAHRFAPYIYKDTDDALYLNFGAGVATHSVDISGWTAGTRYHVAISWDSNRPIDGTNHIRITINDTHNFGQSDDWAAVTVPSTIGIGHSGSTSADAIIEMFRIDRFVWYDGTYGTDIVGGDFDLIAAAYNAGAGEDPAQWIGAWDATLCVPTDQAGGQFTGTGQAWSMPMADALLETTWMDDGNYYGEPHAWGLTTAGANGYADCGSAAVLDDVPAGGAAMTIEGWYKFNVSSSSGGMYLAEKGTGFDSGWRMTDLGAANTLQFWVACATTDAYARYSHGGALYDGRWHHIACTYDDTTKIAEMFVDGVLVDAGGTTTGVGNYQTDAAQPFRIGCDLGAFAVPMDIGWVRYSSNLRYTADFVAPRLMPGADGNTVEQWASDEGSGATIAATVTSPGNDGTLNGTYAWIDTWDWNSTTPVVPQSLNIGGITNCGSAAALDNLPNAAVTVDYWARGAVDSAYGARLFQKSTNFYTYATGTALRAGIGCAVTSREAIATTWKDNCWHHWMMTYDPGGDSKIRLFQDGYLVAVSAATAGAYSGDAASNLVLGAQSGASNKLDGAMGWFRLSNNIRQTSPGDTVGQRYFIPNDRMNPPAPDGNTVEQWNHQDGAGTTLTASVTSPGNDGTIYASSEWLNSGDMTLDEPGAEVLGTQGYNLISDGAADGMSILATVTASKGFVLRASISIEADGHGWPTISVYDVSNAAWIKQNYYLPRITDVHTGANNSATLINSNGAFTQQLVGWTVHNVTDNSQGVITAVSGDGTTITAALAGGTDNDWDTNDVHSLEPPNGDHYSRHPFMMEAMMVFDSPAACTQIRIDITNAEGAGCLSVHQVEVYQHSITNGSMDAGAGGPWLPTGWGWWAGAPGALECVQENATIHSPGSSVEWATPAADEGLVAPFPSPGTSGFIMIGCWGYETANGLQLHMESTWAAREHLTAGGVWRGIAGAYWSHYSEVMRIIDTNRRPALRADTGAAGFFDDAYCMNLTAVTLTATPASEPNSAEDGGTRVDGDDQATVPIPVGDLPVNGCVIVWSTVPRRDDTDLVELGNATPRWIVFWGDANNYVAVYMNAAGSLRMEANANGAGAVLGTWATGGGAFVPGARNDWKLTTDGGDLTLAVDGTDRIEISPGEFGVEFNTIYVGQDNVNEQQIDAAFLATP